MPMTNEALTLFNKRYKAIRKEKAIIINLYLMVTLLCFYLFY